MSLAVSLGLGGCAHHAATSEPSVHALKMEGNKTFDDGTLRDQLATEVTGSAVLGKLADKLAPQLGLDVLKVEQAPATTTSSSSRPPASSPSEWRSANTSPSTSM